MKNLAKRSRQCFLPLNKKRLEILAKGQMRLARLDELRQLTQTSMEIRSKRERVKLVELEAEKKKARACVQQLRHVANSVSNQREMEKSKMRANLKTNCKKQRDIDRSFFVREEDNVILLVSIVI